MAYNPMDKQYTQWCRSYYGQYLNEHGYNIIGIYPCRFEESCTCCHSIEQMRMRKDIKKWNAYDKSQLDLYKIKENIINIIKKSQDDVHNMKYRSQISIINTKSFVELVIFWYDITCYHRRIVSKMANTKQPMDGYNKISDIPQFILENEDNIWALERQLHMCEKHIKLDKKIKIYVKEICCGDVNCKEGVHNKSDLICIDDMMTGKCSCISRELYNEQKKSIEQELKLLTIVDEDGFITKSKKKKNPDRVIELTYQLNNMQRMVHLTEEGTVPMAVHIEQNERKPVISEEKQAKRVVKKIY
jgi:hypothetical protein